MGDASSEHDDAMESDALAGRLIAQLRSPEAALGEELVRTSGELRTALVSPSELPWTITNTGEAGELIADLERRASGIADSVSAVIAYDERHELAQHARLTATSLVGDFAPGEAGVQYTQLARRLRQYPAVLVAYASFAVGAIFENPVHLREIARAQRAALRTKRSLGLVDSLGYFREAHDAFNNVQGGNRCEPIGERVREFARVRLSRLFGHIEVEPFLPVGEFLVALLGVDRSLSLGATGDSVYPIPGLFIYAGGSDVHGFLRQRPTWIQGLFDHPVEEILAAFDLAMPRLVRFECGPQGQLEGEATLASWSGSEV